MHFESRVLSCEELLHRRASCLPTMAATRWILALLCLLAILGGGSVHAKKPNAAIESLGTVVFLPDENGDSNLGSRRNIFNMENVLDRAKTDSIEEDSNKAKFYENSKQLRQEIAQKFGITGNEREICFTVESEFKRLAGSERHVRTAEIRQYRVHSKSYLPQDQMNDLQLTNDFKNDFHKLPEHVKDPHDDRSWQPFREFMYKWGSHIIEAAWTGSMYQSWSSAKSSNNYSQQQLEARACVKAEGVKAEAIEACKHIGEKDREEAEKLTCHDTRTVRGGSAETRRELEKGYATRELMEKFRREDDVNEQPVGYNFMPVWEFMLRRSNKDSADEKRALALQAYYDGVLAHGCQLVMTTGQANNHAQMMVPEYTKNDKNNPTGYYMCIRRCQGCHDRDQDCHFDASRTCCRAYGPAALRRVMGDNVVRAPDYNSGFCSSDNGCTYSLGGCRCDKPNEEEGCNYVYPPNPNDESLKYKIIWNQNKRQPRAFESLLVMEQ